MRGCVLGQLGLILTGLERNSVQCLLHECFSSITTRIKLLLHQLMNEIKLYQQRWATYCVLWTQ